MTAFNRALADVMLEEFADIPIVFLTSMDYKEIVVELLALQPAGYILKPVDSRMLLERIEDIIGK